MKEYVVSFKDGRVEKVAAQALLETSSSYTLFQQRRHPRWKQDVVADFAKSELLERPRANRRRFGLRPDRSARETADR